MCWSVLECAGVVCCPGILLLRQSRAEGRGERGEVHLLPHDRPERREESRGVK